MEDVGWWGHECRKRIWTLFVPYIFWNVFYWFLLAKEQGWGLNFGFNPFSLPQHSHLWFVRSLILAVLISPIFLAVRGKIWGLGALFVFIALCTGLVASLGQVAKSNVEAFAIRSWFQGLLFFPIGVYLRFNPVASANWRIWRIINRGGLFLSILPWWFKAFLMKHGLEIIAHWIRLPILLISVIFLFKAIPESKWPKWLTSCSFPIYLIHGAIVIVGIDICGVLGIKDYLSHCSIMFFVAFWAMVVAASIAVTLLMRRCRWLAMVAFGGR